MASTLLTDAGKWLAGSATPVVLVFLALMLIVPAAILSEPVAFLCVSALVVTTLALMFGLVRTGSGFLLVGFGTVTFNGTFPIGALPWMEISDPFLVTGFLLLIPQFARTVLRLPKFFVIGSIGLLTIGTLSAFATDQPGPNFAHLQDVVQGVVLLSVLLVLWQPGRRTVMAAAVVYVFGSCVNVVASVLEGPDSGDRYSGLTSHPNVLGYCQVLSLALVPFLLATLPRKYHWVVGIASVFSMYGIWISGSRAALLGAIVLTLLYPVFKRSIPAALGVAALCLPTLVVVDNVAQSLDSSTALGRLLGASSAGVSNDARRAGAEAGLDQFLNHPLLGDGWLTIWGAHTGYLQVAAAIGVFGLLSYIVLLASILRPLIAVPPPYGLLAVPAFAMVMLDLVLPVLGARYVWCVVGLALCAYRLAELEESDSVSEPLDRKPVRDVTASRRLVPNGSRRLDV